MHLAMALALSVIILTTLLYGWRAAWNSAVWEKSLLYILSAGGVALLYLAFALCWTLVHICLRMSRNHKAILMLLVIPLASTGCGTIMTLSSNRSEFPQKRKYVFAGVRTDSWAAFGSEADDVLPLWVRGMIVLDIPFSAAADTICLPYTIPKALSAEKKGK